MRLSFLIFVVFFGTSGFLYAKNKNKGYTEKPGSKSLRHGFNQDQAPFTLNKREKSQRKHGLEPRTKSIPGIDTSHYKRKRSDDRQEPKKMSNSGQANNRPTFQPKKSERRNRPNTSPLNQGNQQVAAGVAAIVHTLGVNTQSELPRTRDDWKKKKKEEEKQNLFPERRITLQEQLNSNVDN